MRDNRTKFGFFLKSEIPTKIQENVLNAYDLVFTKDTREIIFIRDDLSLLEIGGVPVDKLKEYFYTQEIINGKFEVVDENIKHLYNDILTLNGEFDSIHVFDNEEILDGLSESSSGRLLYNGIDVGTPIDTSIFVKKEDGANGISFEDASHPTWTDIDKAIKGLIAKVEYVAPSITSFTMSPSTTVYEIGQTIPSLLFTWSYNKDIETQTLTDITLTDSTIRTATYNAPLSTNKTFTLICSDGTNTARKDISVAFRNKFYYGSAIEPDNYDSSFILGLSGKAFATAKKGSYSMTVASGQYGYLAYPASFGTISSVVIGGFDTDVVDCGKISFTNASGGIAEYLIYRTGRQGLGSITMEVK